MIRNDLGKESNCNQESSRCKLISSFLSSPPPSSLSLSRQHEALCAHLTAVVCLVTQPSQRAEKHPPTLEIGRGKTKLKVTKLNPAEPVCVWLVCYRGCRSRAVFQPPDVETVLTEQSSAPRSATLPSRFLTSPSGLAVRSDEVTPAVKANKQKSSPFPSLFPSF